VARIDGSLAHLQEGDRTPSLSHGRARWPGGPHFADARKCV